MDNGLKISALIHILRGRKGHLRRSKNSQGLGPESGARGMGDGEMNMAGPIATRDMLMDVTP
jgi:hypothetical protein